MRVAVNADFVAGIGDRLHFLVERFDRVSRNIPRRIDTLVLEELQHSRNSLVAGRESTREVSG
jgi:hypothetical protein